MRAYLLSCAVLLTLAGCAAHAPRCNGRLTPINRQSIPPDSISDPPRAPAPAAPAGRPAKAAHS